MELPSLSFKLDHNQEEDRALAARLEESPLSEAEFAEIQAVLKQSGRSAGAVAKELEQAVNPATVAPEIMEAAEVDPRLTAYKRQYDGSGNPKLKAVPWAQVQARILEDEGFQLKAAMELEQGGELFGIDKEGNPLISDGGNEPVMKGMTCKDTRDRVHFKHTSNDKAGTLIPGEDSQPIPTGYEMFGQVEPYEKSDEILQYEAHTGKKFVQNSQEPRSSWLESGENPGSPENPSWPRVVYSNPNNPLSFVLDNDPLPEDHVRGVRRLLRVKKKA